jgi:hypothetical protein
MLNLGIDMGFKDDKFFMIFNSCSRAVENFRRESEKLAVKVYERNKNLILSLSSGLDSQIVLHSFYSQGIPLKCAFLHTPGFNEIEYTQVLTLKKKYNLDLEIIDLDPNYYKEELLQEYSETKIPPYQLLHKKFLSLLPKNYDFIHGIDGPDLIQRKNRWYILHTANSFVNSRLRGYNLLNREAEIISWEKTPEIYLSLIGDDIFKDFMTSYNYISNNGLSYQNDTPIPIIDHYDLYIKPFIYAKYWKNELEYFPKYQGPENISWVMEKKWHRYLDNRIIVQYDFLVSFLGTIGASPITLYEDQNLE